MNSTQLFYFGIAATVVIGMTAPLSGTALGLSKPVVSEDEQTAAQLQSETLVVDGDADGDDEYETIQGAVDAASNQARIEVSSGTYTNSVRVDKDVTLVAPNGAVMSSSPSSGGDYAVLIGGEAAPTISGFTIRDWSTGVSAVDSEGAWVLSDVSISDADIGVNAFDSSGAWVIRNSTVRDSAGAVQAGGSTGDWAIQDSRFVSNQDAVDGDDSSGNWVVRDSTFRDNAEQSVQGDNSVGAWTVQNSTFAENADGVHAYNSFGEWVVRDSIFRDNTDSGVQGINSTGAWVVQNSTFIGSPDGVHGYNSKGPWTVQNSTFIRNYNAVQAYNSSGDWVVQDSTFRDNTDSAVQSDNSVGTWMVHNSTFIGNAEAVYAYNASGAWSIQNSTISNNDLGIVARNTDGNWQIHNSAISNNDEYGLNAEGVQNEADVTRNYWGAADGPSGDFSGSGDAILGDVLVEPYYTDSDLTTLSNGERRTETRDSARGDDDPTGAGGGAENRDGDTQPAPSQSELDKQAGERRTNKSGDSVEPSQSEVREFIRTGTPRLPLSTVGGGVLLGMLGVGFYWRLHSS